MTKTYKSADTDSTDSPMFLKFQKTFMIQIEISGVLYQVFYRTPDLRLN